MKGLVTLPISGGGGKIRAALTLLSKERGRYDGAALTTMHELGVEQALTVAEANIVREQAERVRVLKDKLTKASGYRELAHDLAEGVADCFEWDYVAVFGVDRRAGKFRFVEQCNRTGFDPVDAAYLQDLTAGLLGAALRDNALRQEPDLKAGVVYDYKPVVPERRSALAVPVHVPMHGSEPTSDDIEWILSVESGQTNAFRGAYMASLEDVVAQCEVILSRRWHRTIRIALLEAAEQAVVIVDRGGRIRLTNRRANHLLCRPGGVVPNETLASFSETKADERLLRSTDAIEQQRLTLRAGEGVQIPVLATQRPLGDDYGCRLWLFTDLREKDWQANWHYLEQTVNEVAQNTRLPLLLAGSLIRKAARLLQEPAISKLLERAVRQIGKADIPTSDWRAR